LYLGCIVSTIGFPYPDWWVFVWVLGAGAVLGQQTRCGGEPDSTIPIYLGSAEKVHKTNLDATGGEKW